MEYMTPNFTKDMVKTHKILIPNMAVTQFRLMQAALASEGYQTEVLGNCGSEVAQLGLKYVHNDTCYPALLVIGQFLDALNSGKYDLEHTALLITQTGGGCRASNYIHLLRKALAKAGMDYVPVISVSFGLEKNPGFSLTVSLIRKDGVTYLKTRDIAEILGLAVGNRGKAPVLADKPTGVDTVAP